jgi:hypothetical protein
LEGAVIFESVKVQIKLRFTRADSLDIFPQLGFPL